MEQVNKVLIIGSYGMAGHVIYTYLKENTNFELVDIARNKDFHQPKYQLDITNFKDLNLILEKEKPNFVINCIGILNKDAEENPDKAILLNTYLPHFLVARGREFEFRLIHISTDCVFSGEKGEYLEDSFKDGLGFYSQSKSLGEINDDNNLTFRTSIIGPELKKEGIGLFNWFMNQKGVIKGYTNAYWTGITTIELSKAIHFAIEKNITGLHHLVNNQKINKYDLITLIKTIFNKDDIEIVPYNGYKVDKSLVKSKHLAFQVSPYKKMVTEMKKWIENHSNLYDYQSRR